MSGVLCGSCGGFDYFARYSFSAFFPWGAASGVGGLVGVLLVLLFTHSLTQLGPPILCNLAACCAWTKFFQSFFFFFF